MHGFSSSLANRSRVFKIQNIFPQSSARHDNIFMTKIRYTILNIAVRCIKLQICKQSNT